MRDFFKDILVNLEVLTGFRQYEVMCERPNAEELIRKFLDEMEAAARRFGKIPDELKQKRLKKALYEPSFAHDYKKLSPMWVNIVLSEYWSNTYRQVYESEQHQKWLAKVDKEYEQNKPSEEFVAKKMKEFREQVEKLDSKEVSGDGAGTRLRKKLFGN